MFEKLSDWGKIVLEPIESAVEEGENISCPGDKEGIFCADMLCMGIFRGLFCVDMFCVGIGGKAGCCG